MIAHVFGTRVSSFILAARYKWAGVSLSSSNCQVVVAFTEERMFLLVDDVCELTVNQFYTKSVLTFSKLFCHSTLSVKETGLRQDYDDARFFNVVLSAASLMMWSEK